MVVQQPVLGLLVFLWALTAVIADDKVHKFTKSDFVSSDVSIKHQDP